jgi:adenine-specific DNA glycosylase
MKWGSFTLEQSDSTDIQKQLIQWFDRHISFGWRKQPDAICIEQYAQ